MYKIADFNSLWEIGFAINVIFVYFELQQFLEKRVTGIQSIGRETIDEIILEKHRHRVNICGWKKLLFGYVIWLQRLKFLSIINSIVALMLIIISGYNPDAAFGNVFSAFIIILMFAPILVITVIILYLFPIYKVKCIEYEINRIIEMNQTTDDLSDNMIQKYKAVIEYIKFSAIHFPFSFLVKRDKSMSIEEVFRIIHDDKNKDLRMY